MHRYIKAIDARGNEVTFELTDRAVEFLKAVNPREMPERCPKCQWQSVVQGQTFQFATIVITTQGKPVTKIDGFACVRCNYKLETKDGPPR